MSLCTIVCDASWCPETEIGAWAAWIVCEDVRHQQWGVFKEPCSTSNEAEIKAAINGLHFAKSKFANVARYHLVVDCKGVIYCIEKRDKWWKVMSEIVDNTDITAKHVRGHRRSNGSKRTWVNNWCDKKARATMREARDSSLNVV